MISRIVTTRPRITKINKLDRDPHPIRFLRQIPSRGHPFTTSACASYPRSSSNDLQRALIRSAAGIPLAPPTISPRPGSHLYKPPKSSLASLPPYLRLLYNHVAHSFLPANQHTRAPDAEGQRRHPTINFILDGEQQELEPEDAYDSPPERVGAVLSPFEGGDIYIRESVKAVAAALEAEVQVVDLGLTLAGTPITPDPFASLHSKRYEGDGEDVQSHPQAVILKLHPSLRSHIESQTRKVSTWDKEHQVAYFKSVIGDKTPRKKRVILFESATPLGETFSSWWPALQEAIRQRRKGGTVMGATSVLLSVTPNHMPGAAGIWSTDSKAGVRKERNAKRINALKHDPSKILPFPHASRMVSDALIMVPDRDRTLEANERIRRRRTVFASQLLAHTKESIAGTDEMLEADHEWAWDAHVCSQTHVTAVLQAAQVEGAGSGAGALTWEALDKAHREYADINADLARRLRESDPTASPDLGGTDFDIDAVKKDMDEHEQRLEGCIVTPDKVRATSFSDVHLPPATVDAIRSMVSLPLLYPEAFNSGILKSHSTNGALLFGPPGTGKTLLARATAMEAGARMMVVKGSDINDKWLGESEKQVKAVFSLAQKLSPCIVFLDEVDALLGSRSSGDGGGGSRAHNATLNEFMQEMDGLTRSKGRVMVIGATNRPFDLDDAILRRLPRRLLIDLPERKDRRAILGILLKDERLGDDVDLDKLAEQTEGYSGSDLKHVCISAALSAVKETVKLPWVSKSVKAADLPTPASATTGSMVSSTRITPPDALRQKVRSIHCSSSASSAVSSRSTDPDDDQCTTTATRGRVLQWRHFETALKEIRPSASETGAMPELRKWAAQFGEGGTATAQRKGFGKGFGFADDVDKKSRERGFGQVNQKDA